MRPIRSSRQSARSCATRRSNISRRSPDGRGRGQWGGGRVSGVYKVKVELQGFQTLLQERVILSANENLALGGVPALLVGESPVPVAVVGADGEVNSAV